MGLKAKKYTDNDSIENYKVLNKETLNFLDALNNSNKFYTIELHELNGKYRIFTDYGRLGITSKKEIRESDSLHEAEKEYNKIINSKIKKGYTKVELAQSLTGSQKAQELIDSKEIKSVNDEVKESNLNPIIQDFVRQIFDEAGKTLNFLVKGSFNSDGSSPLGKLSSNQIEKGRKILLEIVDILNKKQPVSEKTLLEYTNQYFASIPKVFGHKISLDNILLKTVEQVSEEMDILKFYEDSLRMGGILYEKNNIDKQYESLQSEIDVLDENSEKYKELVQYVNESESKHHSVTLKVKRIFTVKQKNAPAFDDSCGNVKELFHGSRSANIPGILSSSLRLPKSLGKNVVITGAMFGPGIYFASQSTKSSQYSCSRFGGTENKHKSAFMFVSAVALGKVKEVKNATYFHEAPKGYDSVRGVQGPSLLHDEYIVYKENQQEIRYIIEFEPKRKYKRR